MSVYFITCRELTLVKIGTAFNPRTRLNTLQGACPLDLELEAWVRGSYREEKEYHAQFAAVRVRGEWFRITPDIDAIIKANPVASAKSKMLFLKRAREMQGPQRQHHSSPEMTRQARRYAEVMAEMRAEQERGAAA